jgi:hypothetical protein
MKEYGNDLQSQFEKLPQEYKREASDFVQFLLQKEKAKKRKGKSRPENDPILDFVGLVNTESFSKDIDNQLYGGDA